jgi:crotonobetainyl-CoA:carnitine CoA-transferase CaiB-like acyl-CoA transferase
VNQASAYTGAGVVAGRMGNRHPSIAPYELYDARDGQLVVAAGNDRMFATACEVMGIASLAADPRFATNPARVENREALHVELSRAFAERDVDEWVALFNARRVPAGPVNDIAGAFKLASSLGLDPIVSIARDGGSEARVTRNPVRLSATPATYRTPPPLLPD